MLAPSGTDEVLARVAEGASFQSAFAQVIVGQDPADAEVAFWHRHRFCCLGRDRARHLPVSIPTSLTAAILRLPASHQAVLPLGTFVGRDCEELQGILKAEEIVVVIDEGVRKAGGGLRRSPLPH